ncbi:hypothetical protein QBC38DRAFT_524277 [Podospora fimiseda]|uniref:BTB domain-containing protein n=1 Tax=Podospora fimiseda TaxID=252190 RepID=A0AAN7H147_9PEZI|nr:hypothetical protein QBC38DRAFT_524277 [Podospora fimiseda]
MTQSRDSSTMPNPTSQPHNIANNTASDNSSSWLTERIVFIQVGTGPQKKRFPVHEKLITANSPFFDEYFNNPEPGEELPDIMKLPDIDVQIFTKFMNWVYATSHSLRARFRFPMPGTPEAQGMTVRDYLAMYVMGYRFQMYGLRNAVLDVLYDYYSAPPNERDEVNMEDVKYIFDNTPTDSPMRRYLVCQLLFYFFGRERAGQPLPKEWATVLGEQGDIGFSMWRMLNDWAWGFENQVPRMIVKPRIYFYDEPVRVKVEKQEDWWWWRG